LTFSPSVDSQCVAGIHIFLALQQKEDTRFT
jgi:hypothetical protein